MKLSVNATVQLRSPTWGTAAMPAFRPLTRVRLTRIPGKLDVRLRFGRPVRTLKVDDQRRIALFAPGAVFCRLRWIWMDRAGLAWELQVLQADDPLGEATRIEGIVPRVHVLVRADGERQVRLVQQRIASIGALGFDPSDASPMYWRMVQRRLSAGLPLPDYTVERHAAHLAARGVA